MNEKETKLRDAFNLFYESILKPDSELRQCAHEQECYYELMGWREKIIEYLDTVRSNEYYL